MLDVPQHLDNALDSVQSSKIAFLDMVRIISATPSSGNVCEAY